MSLQILWFVLWGLLWAVYFMLDGFDFGAGMLRNFLARGETERRMALRSIGPVWNGNEVWLITAGGATFAAFPAVYATMFSLLYLPMLLILFSLIARGVAIEFRSKGEGAGWRGVWDWVLAVTSLTAPLVLGLGFGNIFRGLPFDSAGYHGSFGQLFNPYGLLTALLFIVLFLQHGAAWLAFRTTGDLAERARRLAGALWYVVLAVVAGFLVSSVFATGLFGNYRAHPGLLAVPLLAAAALVAVKLWTGRSRPLPAFLCSCALIVLVMASALVGLFPNLIPSRSDPASSLTAFNSSSGTYTLTVMAIVALVFVPIVIVYQLLVYRFFRAPVTGEEAAEEAEGY
jgi:cytochrome d ubiquinol oxidase subunit II